MHMTFGCSGRKSKTYAQSKQVWVYAVNLDDSCLLLFVFFVGVAVNNAEGGCTAGHRNGLML